MTVHELFPYLCVRDVRAATEFYVSVFGAREKFRLVEPGGRIGHLELELGPHVLMLCEPFPEYGVLPPQGEGRPPCVLHLHVDDADAVFARAREAGAEVVFEVKDQFYGERSGRFRDPFGHEWLVGHSIEELTPEEMQRRYDALFE